MTTPKIFNAIVSALYATFYFLATVVSNDKHKTINFGIVSQHISMIRFLGKPISTPMYSDVTTISMTTYKFFRLKPHVCIIIWNIVSYSCLYYDVSETINKSRYEGSCDMNAQTMFDVNKTAFAIKLLSWKITVVSFI